MFSKWDAYMEKNYKKVRERCRKGIPMSVRPRAWLHLCGGNKLLDKYPGQYEKFLNEPGDPKCMDDIKKDLHRYLTLYYLHDLVQNICLIFLLYDLLLVLEF